MKTNNCPLLDAGTLYCDFRALSDAELLVFNNPTAQLRIAIEREQLAVTIVSSQEAYCIQLEDAHPVCNGQWHNLTITVSDTGTRVYVDGNLEMSSTSRLFTQALQCDQLSTVHDDIAEVKNLTITDKIYDAHTIQALITPPSPFVQFATSYLDAVDVKRLAQLHAGTICLRFRTRGIGQAGTILSAGKVNESKQGEEYLSITTDGQDITYQARVDEAQRSWSIHGNWEVGEWVDLALRVDRGAVDFYCNGYRVDHLPGQSFFADIPDISQVTIGQNIFGDRLFGEVSEASIYDYALSEGLIRKIAHVIPPDATAVFDRGMCNAASYRIPALTSFPSGTILAACDQRIACPNDAPNEIHFVARKSHDNGIS